jgi:hypothetical protein
MDEIYGNGDEILDWIQMACERFQNLSFVMCILVIKMAENLLTNPNDYSINISTSFFFLKFFVYILKKDFILCYLL